MVLAAFWTLRFFMPAMIWAGILAIALWPHYQRAARLHPGEHRIVLPALFTVLAAFLFLLPVGVALVEASRDMHAIAHWLTRARETGIPVPTWLHPLPLVGDFATTWWEKNLGHPGWATDLMVHAQHPGILDSSRLIGIAVLHRLTLVVCALLTLFFLLRDGGHLAAQMLRGSQRAFGAGGERMLLRVVASVHGVIEGLVLVGLVVGLLMGCAYALVGVPHAALMGALTAVGAMVPFGAPLMFGLAALLLLAKGVVGGAVLIVGLGVALTFISDHFVRPLLIGGSTRLPFPFVLFGILGGLEAWGLLGLFLGPALLAVLVMLWREWTAGPEERQTAAAGDDGSGLSRT